MISLSDLHIALDDVNMRKKSWITRNKFVSDDEMYSLRVRNISQNRYINQHYFIDLLSQIKQFKEYFYQINRNDSFIELIMELLNLDFLHNHEKLNIATFNVRCLRLILSILNIKTGIILSSSFSVDANLKGADRLITLAKMSNAEVYLNLESGRALYSKHYFADNGLNLTFNTSDDITSNSDLYQVQHRSILKALSVFGPDVIKNYLQEVIVWKNKHLLQ